MQFGTAAKRDAALKRLQNRGLVVRTLDTDDAVLTVIGKKADLETEAAGADQVSSNAKVVANGAVATRSTWVRGGAIKLVRQQYGRLATGIAVAVIDSGYQAHQDLPLARIRAWKDFVAGSATPVDGCGHGTHVTGIVGGTGEASNGLYTGVAPEVDIVSLRVLGNDCSGDTSNVIEALQWVLRNAVKYNIRVVNLSLGHPVFEKAATDPMVIAVEKLSRRGILVVTSAGNMGVNPLTGQPGYGGVGVPCNAPSSLCVGALDTKGTEAAGDDAVTDYSSRGPTRFDLLSKPDLVASGHKVISLSAPNSKLFVSYPSLQVFGGQEKQGQPAQYLTLSGTSMSSPVAAGSAALVIGANPGLSAATTKMILMFTARVLPGVDTLTQGAGALNTLGAVQMAQSINPTARLGTSWLTRGALIGSNADANGQTVKWGKRIIYGNRFIVGNAASVHIARWDDNIVWGYDSLLDNIVWGNNGQLSVLDNALVKFLKADNVVWGDNIVWGDNVVWGYWSDNVVWGFAEDNVVWGNVSQDDFDNIVWGNDWDNIVWGNCAKSNASDDDNIVWGNFDDDNVVWGNSANCGKGK